MACKRLFSFYYFRFIVEKCDGDLRIENRKKKEMIAELVRRNYDVDPVRIWKMKTDKESALVSIILMIKISFLLSRCKIHSQL